MGLIKRLKEAIFPIRKVDQDEENWVSLGKSKRDLYLPTQQRANEVAYYLWLTDPIASRITQIITDFVIGEGMKLTADDERVQRVLDTFWYDEVNDFDTTQDAWCIETILFGELLPLPFINPVSGLVQLSRIDPASIKDIVVDEKFPQVARKVILMDNVLKDDQGNVLNEVNVIRRDTDPKSPTAGRLTGDAFYFARNRIAGKRRGHSDIFRVHEWLDIYQKRLWHEAERQEFSNAYVWDVLLKGASEQQVEKFLEETDTPTSGSIRAHNESVEWNAVSPDLKTQDFATANRQFLQNILGSWGLPEHWFTLGGEVNFATAKAMAEPTFRMLKKHQKFMKSVMERLCDYQIEKAVEHGSLPVGNWEYNVIMDEISNVDLTTLSSALQGLAASLSEAEMNSWITKDDAASAFTQHFAQTGIEIEPLSNGETDQTRAASGILKLVQSKIAESKKNREKKTG